MRTYRFFCETPVGDSVCLDPTESRHLHKVLRLKTGQCVQLFDGKGMLADARVEHITPQAVRLHIIQQVHKPAPVSGRVILAVSLAKGERFDRMIEKCTELGADHFAVVRYERTVKMGKSSLPDRYHKIAMAAVKQCGRLYLPAFSGPAGLEQTLGNVARHYPEARLMYGDPQGRKLEVKDDGADRPDQVVFIGPEGGLSEGELQLLTDFKVQPICINPHTLRIETAAIAFSAGLRLV